MKFLELSIENVKKDCLMLSKKVEKSKFIPDTVIYIKTGGYLVGKEISDYFNVPLRGFRISREGNQGKKKLSVILKILPKCIKNILREIEMKSGVHKRKNKRRVTEIDDDLIKGTKILIVDDSVDTGNTIVAANRFLKENYGENLNIKVLSLNKFSMSNEIVNTDYYLYQDNIIIYPWSKDSREYKEFINLYNSCVVG